MLKQPPPQLNYAPRLPWHRRRRFQRGVFLIGVIALIASAIYYGPPAWHRTQILYYQRQCLTHLFPAKTVIHDPSAEVRSAEPAPHAYTQLARLLALPPGLSSSAAFLHERTNSQGVRKLVIVAPFADANFLTYIVLDRISLSGDVAIPAGLYLQSAYDGGVMLGVDLEQRHMRIYAGQPNPHDDSHFTFAYEMNGESGTIDAWLRDGNHIEFKVRDGPAVNPPRLISRQPYDDSHLYRRSFHGILIDER